MEEIADPTMDGIPKQAKDRSPEQVQELARRRAERDAKADKGPKRAPKAPRGK